VQSVACTPHVQDVSYHDGYVHLTCVVSSTDRSSYTTDATIEACAFQVAGYNFEFDEPGPLDITTAPLPQPTVKASATGSGSLFYASNLQQVVDVLKSRFSGNQLILSMALYPGRARSRDRRRRRGAAGDRPPVRGADHRPADAIRRRAQRDRDLAAERAVPERLAAAIAAHGGVPTGEIARFVLGTAGGDAIWKVYRASGSVRFQAHIMADALKRISGGRTTRLTS
jgi:hypothetical protein